MKVKKGQGKKPSGKNLELLNELTSLFTTVIKGELEDATKLSAVLNYYTTTILTSIENNIKMNFIQYVRRFVNSSFKKDHNDILENCQKGTKTKLRPLLTISFQSSFGQTPFSEFTIHSFDT